MCGGTTGKDTKLVSVTVTESVCNLSYFTFWFQFKERVMVFVLIGPVPCHCFRNRSALAVNCCVIIHCLEVSCKEDQITSVQRE